MSKEHRKKKNKFERPSEKDFRSKKGRVMWIKIMGGKSDMITEKNGGKEHKKCNTQWAVCVHLFRNTFKPSKIWTALKTSNPMITSSLLVYPSSSYRMKNWEDFYHSHFVNALSHSRFLCYRKNSHPIYSFCILPCWNTPRIQSHIYLKGWDLQHAVFRSLQSFSLFTTWISWLQEIRVAGEATFYL